MAQIYRRPYYVNRKTGKLCGKNDPHAVPKRSEIWRIRYWLPSTGSNGKKQRKNVPGYKDKKATEALAAQLERRAAREHAGLIDPLQEHAKKPLADHVADYIRFLEGRHNSLAYVATVKFRLTAMIKACRFVHMIDIQSSIVVEYLADLCGKGRSIKTANGYLSAMKSFTCWLWRDKRINVDMVAGLSKLRNSEADLRHARRACSLEELKWLFEAARTSSKSICKLTGMERFALYLTACATGFLASELATMTPENFDLDSDTPMATLQANCTKNRKKAIQPLPKNVAEMLRAFLRDKPAGQPVWPGDWRRKGAKMMRADLKKARKAWLESFQDEREREQIGRGDFLAYRDQEGRYADFHALRHTFISMIGKLDLSPRELQELARQSNYTLTSKYMTLPLSDLAAAMQRLPLLTGGPTAETQRP